LAWPSAINWRPAWAGAWNSRILGGRGESAIPYIHAREMAPFMSRVIESSERLEPRQVLIASPSHTVSHRDLYEMVRRYSDRQLGSPVLMPAPLARIGVWARDLVGRVMGNRPFERPWMADYIDQALSVDPSRTHQLIGWVPRPRLFIERRMAFLLDHRKTDPLEWSARNRAAAKVVHLRPNLMVHRLLERHQDEICRRFLAALVDDTHADSRFPSARQTDARVLEWRFTVALRHILNSVRADDRGLFLGYCRDLAEKRLGDGIGATEIVDTLRLVNTSALEVVCADSRAEGLEAALLDHLTMTIEFGCDQVLEIYEDLAGEEIPD